MTGEEQCCNAALFALLIKVFGLPICLSSLTDNLRAFKDLTHVRTVSM